MVADPVETAELLALAKALAVAKRNPQTLVIGGDTVVALGSRQFSKPRSQTEGVEMLMMLSSQQHRVISAVALVWPGGQAVLSDIAEVSFRALSVEEVEAYVATGEPMDKAGGYAIQGRGAMFVRMISGSYSGIMGLPLFETAEMLRRLHVID